MAEEIHYIESDGTDHTLTGGDNKYLDGDGLMEFFAEPVIDVLPARINILRDNNFTSRNPSLRFRVAGSSYQDVQANVRTLLGWFVPDIDAGTGGTIRVIVDAGGTYDIQAAPRTPTIERLWRSGAFVTVNFACPSQFWQYLPAGSASGSFNGATPVNVAFDNTGDVRAYPTHTLTGVVDTPRITYPSGDYIEIGTVTANATDVLRIYCKPGELRIDYQAGGTAEAVNWTGYAGTASTFAPLPIGSDNMVLSAASGTADYEMTWDNLRFGIG